jgi:hypothetical protein
LQFHTGQGKARHVQTKEIQSHTQKADGFVPQQIL